MPCHASQCADGLWWNKTIGGQTNNGQGGAGVSPTARIMVLRVGNDLGSISTTASVNAFLYAGRRGARIVNYSAGGPAFSSAMLAAIQWLNSKGVLLAVASRNGGDDHVGDNNDVTPTYPASYPVANIVSVAATDQAGALARFSNFGASSVHIAAPGTNMLGADIHRSLHYLENFEGSLAGSTQGHNPGSLSSLNWSVFLE